jgi:uncharacterized iron-regulated protein
MAHFWTMAGLALLLAAGGAAAVGRQPPATAMTCPAPGGWILAGAPADADAVTARAAAADIVLIGERHDRLAHRLWAVQVLDALKAQRTEIVVGLEMLPGEAQGALDRYGAGVIDEATFLAESRWAEVWGFDFALYRPVFDWARREKVRLVALNVDRSVVRTISREGYAAAAGKGLVPAQKPRPPSAEYQGFLDSIFAQHGKAPDRDRTARFTDAQQTWDRVMAERLAAARAAHPAALVVGLMGFGHVQYGHGVAWQLAPMGAPRVMTLAPWDSDRDCADFRPDFADAVRGIG